MSEYWYIERGLFLSIAVTDDHEIKDNFVCSSLLRSRS